MNSKKSEKISGKQIPFLEGYRKEVEKQVAELLPVVPTTTTTSYSLKSPRQGLFKGIVLGEEPYSLEYPEDGYFSGVEFYDEVEVQEDTSLLREVKKGQILKEFAPKMFRTAQKQFGFISPKNREEFISLLFLEENRECKRLHFPDTENEYDWKEELFLFPLKEWQLRKSSYEDFLNCLEFIMSKVIIDKNGMRIPLITPMWGINGIFEGVKILPQIFSLVTSPELQEMLLKRFVELSNGEWWDGENIISIPMEINFREFRKTPDETMEYLVILHLLKLKHTLVSVSRSKDLNVYARVVIL